MSEYKQVLDANRLERRQVLQSRVKSLSPETRFSRFRDLKPSTSSFQFHHFIMSRAPLISIADNRSHRTELTSFERDMITEAQTLKTRSIEIEKTLNFTKSIVLITLKKNSTRKNDVIKFRSDRSDMLSDRDRKYIIKHARLNFRLIYAQLKLESKIFCFKFTFYRTLRLYELINWVIKKRFFLISQTVYKRLKWCQAHREWTFEQWLTIIWSNECSIEKKSEKQRIWVFKYSHEKWNKKTIQSVVKEKKISVIIWAAFWKNEKFDLYKLNKDFKAKKINYFANSYFEILNDNLLEIWESGLVFMQNNASIHKTKKMTKWFETNEINVMNWSFYSSDLNFIEHLWYELKKLVYQINSNINLMKNSDDTIREILWKTLKEIWTLINVKMMKKLIKNIKRKINAVIATDEWYTKY